ncbi:MAG TPA: cupredoxin domain-containing protein [Stellaceae bacterium]|nr:cupredoxin domain-containing protein [Stellaceae bacterium]
MMRALPAFALLLATAALPARAADLDWSKAQRLTMTMEEYKFTPNHLTLHRGQLYRLHMENRGKEEHELTAPQFLGTVIVGNPEMVTREGTEVDLQPGEEKDLLFIPNQAGDFPFACGDHEAFGMTGGITVE